MGVIPFSLLAASGDIDTKPPTNAGSASADSAFIDQRKPDCPLAPRRHLFSRISPSKEPAKPKAFVNKPQNTLAEQPINLYLLTLRNFIHGIIRISVQKLSLISVSQSTKIKLVDIAYFNFTKHDYCTVAACCELYGFNYRII